MIGTQLNSMAHQNPVLLLIEKYLQTPVLPLLATCFLRRMKPPMQPLNRNLMRRYWIHRSTWIGLSSSLLPMMSTRSWLQDRSLFDRQLQQPGNQPPNPDPHPNHRRKARQELEPLQPPPRPYRTDLLRKTLQLMTTLQASTMNLPMGWSSLMQSMASWWSPMVLRSATSSFQRQQQPRQPALLHRPPGVL